MSQGFTLIELLIVIAIIGILAALGVMGLRGLSRSMEVTGYANSVTVGVQQAASRANTTGTLYVVAFGANSVSWGPSSLSLRDCETATSAPALGSESSQFDAPTGSTVTTGWLCVSAPGLVSRLDKLPTCISGSLIRPCYTVSRGTSRRNVILSASGQADLQ